MGQLCVLTAVSTSTKNFKNQSPASVPVIPALRSLRQDCREFEASLEYTQ